MTFVQFALKNLKMGTNLESYHAIMVCISNPFSLVFC